MSNHSRREFLSSAAMTTVTVGTGMSGRLLWANPLGLPLGLQLYSVREQMAQDLVAALAGVHAAGFVEVEAASLPRKPASEIRAVMDKTELKCVSAHHSFAELTSALDQVIAFDMTLGCRYIICASPGRRNPTAAGSAPGPMTLDDWKYCAEQFNILGEKTAAVGIKFGYHNHVGEFSVTDGKIPYLELLRLTDPKKVTMELDCGWARVSGMEPATLMRDNPYRFSMLHVKDFHLPEHPSPQHREDAKVTELGKGIIDYRTIFAEARKTQHLTHAFVEQEEFDMPWQQSLRVDAQYMKALKV